MTPDSAASATPRTDAVSDAIDTDGSKLLADDGLTRKDAYAFAASSLRKMSQHARQLERENARLREALKLLVVDVADYEAWQRPCYALEQAKAALVPHE